MRRSSGGGGTAIGAPNTTVSGSGLGHPKGTPGGQPQNTSGTQPIAR